MYAFFDGVNVTGYITPKIIELVKSSTADPNTNETPFVVGETVIGEISSVKLKVAPANDGMKTDPYGTGANTLAESYASQTAFLNIDVTAMAESVNPNFFGNVVVGEVLVGQTSGARAVVRDRRLLTDNIGNLKAHYSFLHLRMIPTHVGQLAHALLDLLHHKLIVEHWHEVDSSADTTYMATVL